MRFTARRLIASLSVLGLLAAQSTAFAADEQKKVEFFEGKELAGASESAKDDTTISTRYNFSKADTKSESKTVTYKIPSQSITLEPGQTVEVRARLEKVKTAGKVRLIGDINGTESGYVNLQKLVGDIGLVPTPDHKLLPVWFTSGRTLSRSRMSFLSATSTLKARVRIRQSTVPTCTLMLWM